MGFGARRHGVADARRRLLDREAIEVDVAAIGDLRRQLPAGFDVVAADPRQGSAKQLRRAIARSRSHRACRERRADQPDRGTPGRGHDQLAEIGPACHRFTLAPPLA